MLKIGEYNTLEILRETSVGLFLGDEDENEVLLPMKYLPENYDLGDKIEVFLYRDSEDRPVATDLTPKIFINDFAALEVRQVSKFGAFLDWGMEKDLLVPFSEQEEKMFRDQIYLVYLYLDPATDRLVASSNLPKYIKNRELTVAEGDEVDLIIGYESELGTKVIVNKKHWGLIYANELFEKLELGERRKGYVYRVREDNKLDIRLGKSGYANVEPAAQKILDLLKSENGFLALTDKSDPAHIKKQLEMSKKVFKKSIGSLYKKQLIILEEAGIRLKG